MHFEIDRESDATALHQIEQEITLALEALTTAVGDWPAMTARIALCRQQLHAAPPPLPAAETAETLAFIDWLLDDHFVILGCRDYRFTPDHQTLQIEPGSGLGLLRDEGVGGPSRTFAALTPELRALAYTAQSQLILTKADTRSIVHRPVYLDMVCIKQIDASGVVGELRIIGLYTASAYTQPPRDVPVLRRKIDAVLQASGADLTGHRGKALLNVLDTYPRDELMETSEAELLRMALAVVALHERARVRLFFPRRYLSPLRLGHAVRAA